MHNDAVFESVWCSDCLDSVADEYEDEDEEGDEGDDEEKGGVIMVKIRHSEKRTRMKREQNQPP